MEHCSVTTFKNLEEASEGGQLDEDEAYGVGQCAQEALPRLETTKKILDIKSQAVRTAVQAAEEAEKQSKTWYRT